MRIKNLITAALMLMFSIGVFAQYSVNLNGIVVNAKQDKPFQIKL